MLFTELAT